MTTAAISGVQVEDLDASWLLSLAEEAELHERAAVRDKLRLAAQWCVLHPAIDLDVEDLGGEGTPQVVLFASEPFGAALGISTAAAQALLADALDLQHRLPRIWARVEALEIPPWRARRVAQETRLLSKKAAAYVDRTLVAKVDKIGPVLLARAVAEAAARFDAVPLATDEDNARAGWRVQLWHGLPGRFTGTSCLDAVGDTNDLTRFHDLVCKIAHQLFLAGDTDTLDARKAKALGVIADGGHLGTSLVETKAKTKLYLHVTDTDLTDGTSETGDMKVGTVERFGPSTIARIKEWVGHGRVTIQPVLDLNAMWAVDRHDPPPRMREQVILRDPHCVFPHCNRDSRGLDLDHIRPYDPDGPPGQTNPDNLAPLCRRHHRAKTFGRWRYRRDPDGTYTWTAPDGREHAVTPG